MTCRWFHRWGKWESEFEEAPLGAMAVWEWRVRHCERKRCDMFEEVPRCVSLSREVARGLTP
jgi:hypothetical protein